ncbi:uncharacterized protein LOC120779395, partial [Bactrocera tryoni]|uniref:uncharacterized protein LOC120779395 n=1 Tax=Bactrocera tryoni TaxID=59916 RepID=UPI001A96293E
MLPEYDPEDDSDSDEELEDAPIETWEYFTARDGNVWSSIQPQPVRFQTFGPKKKPLLILDYNKTKGGVDSMDMCLSEYSTKRRTNRWPLAFFYNIADVAAFAAYIIYVDNNTHLKSYTSRRRMFLHQLSEQLCKPEIKRRANNSRISRVFSTRNAIEAMIDRPIRVVDAGAHEAEERDSTGRLKVKGNCYICSKRRPTRKACTLCNKPVGAEHSKDLPQCDR